jgi:hypothetical protein
MKFKITEGVNPYNAAPSFMVYRWTVYDWCKDGRWSYLSSFANLEDARSLVALQIKLGEWPLPEKLVAEIEG